jgi:hypothetical protein
MMDDARIAELEALCRRATPEPWIDLTETYRERCELDRKQYGNRWYHGTRSGSTPLALIAHGTHHGKPIRPDDIPRRVDRWDLRAVFSMFWSSLPRSRTVATEGFLRPEDAAWICAARTALPEALAELKRLRSADADPTADLLHRYLEAREEDRRVNTEFVDSIRPGRAASDEVKQASSDALLAARQRTHVLYRALHLAVTGVEAARYGREQVDPDAPEEAR